MKLTVNDIAHRLIELVALDEEIRDAGDEEMFEVWATHGVPDEAVEQVNMGVLLDLVMDDDAFDDLQDLYSSLMHGEV